MIAELVVSGYFKNLAAIGEFVTQAAHRAGLDNRAAYGLQMAVDEACTNIIEHGYGGEGQGTITLIADIMPEGLQITIYDRGHPFDPGTAPALNTQAPLQERRRGMGVFFMHKLTDRLDYQVNTERGNRLVLFKRK